MLVIFRKNELYVYMYDYVLFYLSITVFYVSCNFGVLSWHWALFKWNKTFLKLKENITGPNLITCFIAEV